MMEWKRITVAYNTRQREYRTLDDRYQIVNTHPHHRHGSPWKLYILKGDPVLTGFHGSFPTLKEAQFAAEQAEAVNA